MRFYFLMTRAAATHAARIIAAHDEAHARQVAALAESTEPMMRIWLDQTLSECREIKADRAGIVIKLEGAAAAAAPPAAGRPAAYATGVDEWARPPQKLQ